jgi:hypothetical protein
MERAPSRAGIARKVFAFTHVSEAEPTGAPATNLDCQLSLLGRTSTIQPSP